MVCARDLMQPALISIPAQTPFLEILRLFVVGQIGGAPVVDDRGTVLTALDVVTPDVVWVSPETPIARVAQLMRTEGIHRVLVGDEERLVGILTAFDLPKVIGGASELLIDAATCDVLVVPPVRSDATPDRVEGASR